MLITVNEGNGVLQQQPVTKVSFHVRNVAMS
jgi:hypothetical protein